jgi:hypothetical protein
MNVIEIKGKVNTALCYAKVVEDEALEQIRRMCDYPMTEGSKIRIMPDVHAGKGCTIGTTMTIKDKAVPNVVGVDLGCGMYTVNLGKKDIDLEKYAETGEIVTNGPIDSSKVSYASYKDYIRAVAKCMWFAENPKNTTAGDLAGQAQYANDYAERESDDMEYRTAYDAQGNAIYNSTTTGSNIFQDGTTTTDPVQAQLVKDVIEAYANLYDVTKYAEVESEYKKTKEFFEAAQAEKDGDIEVEIGEFEDIVNATESDGQGQ